MNKKKIWVLALLVSTLTFTTACNKENDSEESNNMTVESNDLVSSESDDISKEESEELIDSENQSESNLSNLISELELKGMDKSKWSVALDDILKIESIAKKNGLKECGFNISSEEYSDRISVWYDKDDERSESLRYEYIISKTNTYSPIGKISYFYNIPELGAIEGIDITSRKALTDTMVQLVSEDYNYKMLQENYDYLVSEIVGGSYKEKSGRIEGNNTGEWNNEETGLYISSLDSPNKNGELNERAYFYMFEISK